MTDALPTLNTVAHVDLTRYAGQWYEVARLPIRFEDDDARDVTANYALKDNGKVQVINRLREADGDWEEVEGEAGAVDDSNAKLEVSFLPSALRWIPFTKGDYWVIRLAEDYSVSLVGTPDRKYLWLLARTPTLLQAVRDDFLSTARREGFDLAKLIHTPQSGHSTT